MGCQNSNLAQIIPVDGTQLHQNEHQPQPQPPTQTNPQVVFSPNGKKTQVDKQNKIPSSQLSIKFNKETVEVAIPNEGDTTKRKTKSEKRIPQEELLMNDKTNIQPTHDQKKKKSIIISEKNKTLSAKGNKDKIVTKIEAEVVGPSTHSIPSPEQKPQEKVEQQMTLPFVVHKQTPQQSQKQKEQLHPVESLSQQLTSQRLSKSFKFQIFIEQQNQLLSKTQKLNKQLEHFIEKQQVAKYLTMIEYGQKQQILGQLINVLQKKEEWNDAKSEVSSNQPIVVVVTEHGQAVQH